MSSASPRPAPSSQRSLVSRRRSGVAPPRFVTRPSAAGQIVLLAVLYAGYSASRLAAADDLGAAQERAKRILDCESLLLIDIEARLNHFITNVSWLAVPASYWYATLHYLVTPAVLVWIYLCRPANYLRVRNTLIIATAIGLIMYLLLPTAPPRLMADGYLDTMAVYHHVGWWSGHASAPRGMAAVTNELAAMPSLHVGWAVWVAWAVHRAGVRRRGQAMAQLYAVGTTLVVIATGNHWVLDAAAGAAVVLIAGVSTRRLGAHRPPPSAPCKAATAAPRPRRHRPHRCRIGRWQPPTALARTAPAHSARWTGGLCRDRQSVGRQSSLPAQRPLPDRPHDQRHAHRLQPSPAPRSPRSSDEPDGGRNPRR